MNLRFYAGGFLYNSKDKSILLHKRDGNTKINPNRWAFFGGRQEAEESPVECFVRELEEETGLKINESKVIALCDYLNEKLNRHRYFFYVESDVGVDKLVLGEGEGFRWIPISEIKKFNLTDKTKEHLNIFVRKLA